MKEEALKRRVEKTPKEVRKSGHKTAFTKNTGFSWEDVKNRKIKMIGKYWQAGIGTGTIALNRIWYAYFFKTPNKNATFFTVAEITEQNYFDLYDKYKRFIYDGTNGVPSCSISDDIMHEIVTFVLQSKIIVEDMELL